MSERVIKISYDIVTPESAEDGDYAEKGWEDEDGVTFSCAAEAMVYLKDKGIESSSSSPFAVGSWYNGEVAQGRDFFEKGEEKRLSYHLHGFTEDEERAIYEHVVEGHSSTAEAALGDHLISTAKSLVEALDGDEICNEPDVKEAVVALKEALASGNHAVVVAAAASVTDSVFLASHEKIGKLDEAYSTEIHAMLDCVDWAEAVGIDTDLDEVAAPKI